jgi:hypothetical protein
MTQGLSARILSLTLMAFALPAAVRAAPTITKILNNSSSIPAAEKLLRNSDFYIIAQRRKDTAVNK